jgi:hypothetical protein
MSDHHNDVVICPNCGSPATNNYCSQCGQENDLHQETVWQLFMHFFGHYFHYDSKFWKTLKVLWFKPGELTVAYHKKQRMRFISPMSLYVFISAIYFLIAFALPMHEEHPTSMIAVAMTDSTGVTSEIGAGTLHPSGNNSIESYFKRKANKIAASRHVSTATYLKEKIWHSAPKVMFLMIPVFAWLLSIRFKGRTDRHFVDHTIFSFHTHSFWFSIRLLSFIEISKVANLIMDITFYSIFFGYMVQAIRKVYNVPGVNAAFTLLGTALMYAILMALIILVALMCYFIIV